MVPKCTRVLLVLAVLEEGVSPLPSLSFSCISHCLCGSCFYPTGSLLPCIKLCGAECSPEKTEPGTTSGDQNQACAQETHCFHVLVPVLYPAPVQDTQGTAGDAVFKKHLLVVLDFTESQAGWGLWGQTALSERICSAPLLRAGALRAGCSRCVQQGWRQKNQKTNVKERQGSGIAHVRMWVPLRMKDAVVLLKSFHLNKYMAFMMTKLLSKKF